MPKDAHIPTRMCVVCMQMSPKKDLIRLMQTQNGNILIDFSQKKGGRGVWIHKSKECIDLAKKRKSLERKFKKQIPDNIFEELNKIVS
ncbi:MAG: YlxR family protein [Clostridia bacterium]|nr:YlxR family protein [Clostridia bacterium]